MTKVLLVTDGFFHPPFLGRMVLRQALKGMNGYQYEGVRSIDRLPANMDEFSALVIYFHHKKLSDNAITAFDEYVSSGGGVLAIHAATASSKGNHTFTDILGGRFIGHGPVEPFMVTPVVPESKIFAGIPEFQVIDELYIHELQTDIETHFNTIYQGEAVPVVWTRRHGKGRICYTCPGHRTGTLKNEAYQSLLRAGLIWVTGA